MVITNGFDSMFTYLELNFYAGINNLVPYCILLLRLFFAYQVIWAMIKNPTELPFMRVALDVIRYGVIYYILTNYRNIMDQLRDTFIKFGGLAAGGGGGGLSINEIYNKWYDKIASPIFDFAEGMNILTNALTVLLFTGAFLIIMALLIIICLNIFLVKLEFVAVGTLGIVFLPFYMFDKTSFIGEVWFRMMINNAIRLMVLTFLVYLTINQMGIITLNLDDFKSVFLLIGSMGGITALVLKVPQLMSSIINGSPQIGQGGTIEKIAEGAGRKAGGAAARGTGSMAKKGFSAIKSGGATLAAQAARMMKK